MPIWSSYNNYFRSRRSSTSDFTSRRHRESNPALFITRSNTATTDEYKRLHYGRHSPSASPYSISRSNTDESSATHQRRDSFQDIEMTIVRTKPDEEDSSLHDLLRIRELERQSQQKRYKNIDKGSGNEKQKPIPHQSNSDSAVQQSNIATVSDISKRASDLDLVIEIDNGETTHI